MLKKITPFLFFIFLLTPAFAQQARQVQGTAKDEKAVKYANEFIKESELKKLVYKLASDEFEGRETGERGQKLAADYIADYFKSQNIAPHNGSYFQSFNLEMDHPDHVTITTGTKEYKFNTDFYFFGGFGDTVFTADKVYFAGYGIDDSLYSDFHDKNAAGNKVLLILSGEPKNNKGNYLLTGTDTPSDWSGNWRKKINNARKLGASAVLIATDNFEENIKKYEHQINRPLTRLAGKEKLPAGMPVIYISEAMADQLLSGSGIKTAELRKSKKLPSSKEITTSQPVTYNIVRRKEIKTGENVIGYIEGTEKKDELIVITAHYDHLGIIDGKIYYGADDDASGTAGIMTIAAAFAKAKSEGNMTRRSILVLPVSGEEKGLFGSAYYVENPLFPLEKTIANLNVDMIGRIDENYKDDPDYVYLIGSDKISTDLHKVSENVNATYTNLKLDYRYNADDDPNRFYYRSDHYNFAKNNIPVIFYFNGVHEDYHEPTDTPDKIHYGKIEKISRLIFFTAWELANQDEPLRKDKLQENQ